MDKKKFTSVGGVVSAFLASTCCVGPVILAGLGVGAGGISFVRGFGKFHMIFMVLTFGLLGAAFYFTYQKKCDSKEGAACCPSEDKKDKLILWLATGLAVIFLVLPFLI